MIHLRYLFISITLLFCDFAHAYRHNFIISPSLYIFDYAEYDAADNFLDGETGVLPGIHFAYNFNHEHFSILAQYSEYGGNVDYDGFTLQTGTPHQTLTDTYLRFYNFTLYTAEFDHQPQLFMRFGSSYWNRNILSSGNVSGLHEKYRWNEISAGFRIEQYNNQLNLWLEFSILKTHSPDMDIFLPSETLNFPLATKTGFRAEAGRYFKLSNNFDIGLSGFIEHWRFGASDSQFSVDLADDIYEPDSESRHWGLRLNIRYRY